MIETPQGKSDLLHACSLLHELQEHGYIEGGGVSVNIDQVCAEIKILAVTEGVEPTEREKAIDVMVGMMKVRGPLSDEDEKIIREIAALPEIKWPPVEGAIDGR